MKSKNYMKQYTDGLDKMARILDNQNIRMLINLNDSKIEYESQFHGDCVLFNDEIKVAYSFVNIPADEIFEVEFSEEMHGWKILRADHYSWWIKENLDKGEEINYSEFKDELK